MHMSIRDALPRFLLGIFQISWKFHYSNYAIFQAVVRDANQGTEWNALVSMLRYILNNIRGYPKDGILKTKFDSAFFRITSAIGCV